MKKTVKALIILFSIITGGISQADPFGSGCNTIYDFQTGLYTKMCCQNGRCTVFTFGNN